MEPPAVIVGAAGMGFTCIVMILLIAVDGETHPAMLVTVSLTASLFFKLELVNVAESVPAALSLIVHLYVMRALPLFIAEENVTGVPGQIFVTGVVIVTTSGTGVLTVTFTVSLDEQTPLFTSK